VTVARGAPVCKVCDHPHYSYEGHVLVGAEDQAPKRKESRTPKQDSRIAMQVIALDGGRIATKQAEVVEVPRTVEDVRRIVVGLNREVERIYDDMDRLGRQLLAIHDTDLWRDMGYQTWEGFIAGEMKLSRRHADRALRHQRFLAMLPAPVNDGTLGPILSERQIRPLSENARERVTKVATIDPVEGRKQLEREVARGAQTPPFPPRATSQTKDPATGMACEHEPVTVTVCKNCGRRLD
jgi:hypothetical protein